MYISASAPEAPPFSDTTMGCFIRLFFCMAVCIMRAIWSDAPPAPAATTISTGLVGSHAAADAAESATASTAPARRQRLLLITSPPHSHGRMALEPQPSASLLLLGILTLCA